MTCHLLGSTYVPLNEHPLFHSINEVVFIPSFYSWVNGVTKSIARGNKTAGWTEKPEVKHTCLASKPIPFIITALALIISNIKMSGKVDHDEKNAIFMVTFKSF